MIRPTKEVEWRLVPGTPYAASSDGRIRRELPGPGARAGHVLAPWRAGGRDGDQYLYVALSVAGKRKKRGVHRLVARAFHGPPRGGRNEVHHLDGDPGNNAPANLVWASRRENCAAIGGHDDDKYPWEE